MVFKWYLKGVHHYILFINSVNSVRVFLNLFWTSISEQFPMTSDTVSLLPPPNMSSINVSASTHKNFSRGLKHLSNIVKYMNFWYKVGTLLVTAPQKGCWRSSLILAEGKYSSPNFWGVLIMVDTQQNRGVVISQFMWEISYVWQKGCWPHPKRVVCSEAMVPRWFIVSSIWQIKPNFHFLSVSWVTLMSWFLLFFT